MTRDQLDSRRTPRLLQPSSGGSGGVLGARAYRPRLGSPAAAALLRRSRAGTSTAAATATLRSVTLGHRERAGGRRRPLDVRLGDDGRRSAVDTASVDPSRCRPRPATPLRSRRRLRSRFGRSLRRCSRSASSVASSSRRAGGRRRPERSSRPERVDGSRGGSGTRRPVTVRSMPWSWNRCSDVEYVSCGSGNGSPRVLLITFHRVMSAQSTKVIATPEAPARPVRPIRCT